MTVSLKKHDTSDLDHSESDPVFVEFDGIIFDRELNWVPTRVYRNRVEMEPQEDILTVEIVLWGERVTLEMGPYTILAGEILILRGWWIEQLIHEYVLGGEQ